jgi:hypothetical protein
VADEVAVGEEDARSFRVRAEDTDGLAGLNEKGFFVAKRLEGAHNGVEGWPIASGAAGATVDDQFVRVLGDFGIEIIVKHAEGGFLVPTVASQLGAARGADCRGESHADWIIAPVALTLLLF